MADDTRTCSDAIHHQRRCNVDVYSICIETNQSISVCPDVHDAIVLASAPEIDSRASVSARALQSTPVSESAA
jgi:hypothetical protein